MDKFEERIEQIEKFASQCYEDGERYSAFIAGAIWADNNPVNVWHDASEEPTDNSGQIVFQNKSGVCWFVSRLERYVYDWNWQRFADAHQIVRWAYIKDLMPKGGEE